MHIFSFFFFAGDETEEKTHWNKLRHAGAHEIERALPLADTPWNTYTTNNNWNEYLIHFILCSCEQVRV
jgi:hypothetical protein